jgi:heat-inducible transcriptional repressor
MTDGRGHYEELSDRARHLLRVLVDRYVREGHPVGSRTLSKESGLELSPATIRNVMSDLEELGYIGSPHTSAGRIPTAKGYRFFVDTMVNLQSLSEGEIRELQDRLARRAGSGRQLVETASNLLSGLTHMAGVVTVPRQVVGSLRQIEFLPLSDRRVLAILVVNDTQVRNRVLNVDRDYTADELKRVSNYLTEQFSGKTIASVRETIVSEMQRTRESMDQLMADAIGIARHIFAEDSSGGGGYYLAGETNLMDFDELSNVDKLRELFEAFGRKRDILHLLDRAMVSADLQIFIGGESGYQILDECSVVVSPYTVDQEIVGVLGVIGPTRMAYERVIPIVDVTARLLGSALKSAD